MLWCSLRFRRRNDVRFVFIPVHLSIWVTWRVSYKKQELLALREHLDSIPFFLVCIKLLMIKTLTDNIIFIFLFVQSVFRLRVCNKSNPTIATSGTGTAYRPGTHAFTPGTHAVTSGFPWDSWTHASTPGFPWDSWTHAFTPGFPWDSWTHAFTPGLPWDSWTHAFTPGLPWDSCCSFFSLLCSGLYFCCLFFWPLYYLAFFDLWLLKYSFHIFKLFSFALA